MLDLACAINCCSRYTVDGVDVLSWGPADLSFNREAYPDHPLKTDDDCIRHVNHILSSSTTQLCLRSYKPEGRNIYLDMGVSMILEGGFY